MTESSAGEVFNQSDQFEIAQLVGNGILNTEYRYSGLSISDLNKYGVLAKGQTYPEFVAQQLILGERLVGEAWESLLSKLPAPNDAPKLNSVSPTLIISAKEERQIREHALNSNPDSPITDPLPGLQEVSRRYSDKAVDAIIEGSKDRDYLNGFDIKDDVANTERVLRKLGDKQMFSESTPTLIKVPDIGYCYGLVIPSKEEEGRIMAYAPSLNNYIIVTDPEKNARITDILLSSPNAITYLLGQEVSSLQHQLKGDLREEIKSASSKRYKELDTTSNKANRHIANHAFRLMARELEMKKGIFITELFRDDSDIRTIRNGEKPRLDRVGSESGIKSFKVTKTEDGNLRFTYEDINTQYVWNEGPEDRGWKVIKTKTTPSVVVKYGGRDEELRFLEEKDGEQIELTEDNEFKNNATKIKELFRTISLLLTPNVIKEKGDEVISKEAKPLIQDLLATETLREFFDRLKLTQNYPGVEYLLRDKERIPYRIGLGAPQGNPKNN